MDDSLPYFDALKEQIRGKLYVRRGQSRTILRGEDLGRREHFLGRPNFPRTLSAHSKRLSKIPRLCRQSDRRRKSILSNVPEKIYEQTSKYRRKQFPLRL